MDELRAIHLGFAKPHERSVLDRLTQAYKRESDERGQDRGS
jgi:hypothetical protein